jgi:hypothetical protein
MHGRPKRQRVAPGDTSGDAPASNPPPPGGPVDILRVEPPSRSPLPRRLSTSSEGGPLVAGASPPMHRLGTPDCMSSPVSHLRNLTRNMQDEARRVHAAQYLCAPPSPRPRARVRSFVASHARLTRPLDRPHRCWRAASPPPPTTTVPARVAADAPHHHALAGRSLGSSTCSSASSSSCSTSTRRWCTRSAPPSAT